MFAVIGKCPWCLQKTMMIGEDGYPLTGDFCVCYECGEPIRLNSESTFDLVSNKEFKKLSHDTQRFLVEEQTVVYKQLIFN